MAEHWYGVAQDIADCKRLQRWGRKKKLTIITCSLEARLFLEDSGTETIYVWDIFDMEQLIDQAFFKAKEMTLEDAFGDVLYKKAAIHRMHVEFLSHAVASKMLADKIVAYVQERAGSVVIAKISHIFFGPYFPLAQRKMQRNPLLLEFIVEVSNREGVKNVRQGVDMFFASLWAPVVYRYAISKQIISDAMSLLWGAASKIKTIDDLLASHSQVHILSIGWGRDLHRMLSLSELHQELEASGKRAVHVLWRPKKLSDKDQSVGPTLRIREQIKKGVTYGPSISMLGLKRWRTLFAFYRSAAHYKAFSPTLEKLSSSSVYRLNILYNAFFSYRETFLTSLITAKIIKKVRPKVMLGSDSGGESARSEMIVAQSAGIRTVSTPHGYQAYAMESYNYLADKVLTYGTATAGILKHCGVQEERISVVGSSHKRSGKNSLGSPIKVVIGTRSWGGLWSNYSSVHPKLDKNFRELLHALKKDDRFEVTIKSHPNGDLHGYYDLLVDRMGSDRIRHIAAGWRAEVFEQKCDILICMGDCPSLYVSALYLNKPIIFVEGCMSMTQKKMGYVYDGCASVVSDGGQAYLACLADLANDAEFKDAFGIVQNTGKSVSKILTTF